jgi:hypothetical protein
MSKAKMRASEDIADMFMKPERLTVLTRCKQRLLMIRSLQKNAKKNLKSAGSVVSGIAPAILRIRASLDQGSLCLIITCGLNIYFTQSTKKAKTDQGPGWDVFVETIV